MDNDNDSFKPHLTIVGGQPKKMKQKRTVKVPVGMEKVLFLAAKDEEFKRKLLDDRQAAIEESGIELRPSEAATFKVISNQALETMIANIVPENPRRRKFMGLVAAAAASLAAGTASNACGEAESQDHYADAGVGADTDIDGDTDTGTDTDTDTDTNTDTDTGTNTEMDAGDDAGGDTDTDTVDTEVDGGDADWGMRTREDVDGD